MPIRKSDITPTQTRVPRKDRLISPKTKMQNNNYIRPITAKNSSMLGRSPVKNDVSPTPKMDSNYTKSVTVLNSQNKQGGQYKSPMSYGQRTPITSPLGKPSYRSSAITAMKQSNLTGINTPSSRLLQQTKSSTAKRDLLKSGVNRRMEGSIYNTFNMQKES